MIKMILPTILLIMVSSGCVGTITNKNMAQDSSHQRQNDIRDTAKGTDKPIVNKIPTTKQKTLHRAKP